MSTNQWKIPAFPQRFDIRLIFEIFLFFRTFIDQTWAFFLDQRWSWKKVINAIKILIIHVLGNFGKKQLKILVGVYVVGFGCFHKAVEDCACFSSIIGFNDDEVLPSDSEGPYGLFGVDSTVPFWATSPEFESHRTSVILLPQDLNHIFHAWYTFLTWTDLITLCYSTKMSIILS